MRYFCCALFVLLGLTLNIGDASSARAGTVDIRDNQLFIDGQPQPQLFGAEIQYFRLRGGQGRNIPREKVIELWNRVLDRAVEAKMNIVSFYIPWDFHEYADGKFDFDGTVDEDGDGRPDYPSRDVHTFIKLVLAHGIKNIMIRPGPYINAEWGFLGFGAVPFWFHEKFPHAHMQNSRGQRTSLYSYSDPDFLRYTKRWLETVYHQVAAPYIGPGKPVHFIQVDNETNFMWQSIYNHDYSPRAISQYQDYLQRAYSTVDAVNARHGRTYGSWAEVRPPTAKGRNIAEDQDWYRFQDDTMYKYLQYIRKVWTDLGVLEPTVLFTLAESYNANREGILPNYKLRNEPGKTGMMTVNLYPKTDETPEHPLWNMPFKADHDVKAADAATDYYLGRRTEWVMGPEIQGGWWRGTSVSKESRQATYLTVLGHGLKAMFIYYFSEGDNWEYDWAKKAITPHFRKLRQDPRYKDIKEDHELPDSFWTELDGIVADNLFANWNTWGIWQLGGIQTETLFFDAALGPDAQPRPPFELVKAIGQKIAEPYGRYLGSAVELNDSVCMIKDSASHTPSPIAGLDSMRINADWAGGLLALLMHSGVNAKIHHWGLNPSSDLLDKKSCQLIIYQDNGFATEELAQVLSKAVSQGATLVSFLHNGLTSTMLNRAGAPRNSVCTRLPSQPIEVDGQRCAFGTGNIYQAAVPIYDVFNTDFYFKIVDAPQRREFIDTILKDIGLVPQLRIAGGGDRTVVFGRVGADGKGLWVTVKTGRTDGFQGRIQWTRAAVDHRYTVTDILAGTSEVLSGHELASHGFASGLGPSGSAAYFIADEAEGGRVQ